MKERLSNSKAVLALTGDPVAMKLAEQLVYSSLITALEAFLWETAHYWVEHDDDIVKNIVTKLPAILCVLRPFARVDRNGQFDSLTHSVSQKISRTKSG